MADSTRDADADVIVSGREPRRGALRPGGLLWLLVVAQAAVLAVTVVVAVHYRAEVVSAVITGGTPGTVYDLIGSDCSTADPLPDEVWATGLARADGTADLAGYAWTGAVANRYWMALDPSPVDPAPGLSGHFAQGAAAPFRAGQAPCAIRS